MWLDNEWQDKQEPALGRLAIAGVRRKFALLWESEIGAGE
jgi:hypothetical protein